MKIKQNTMYVAAMAVMLLTLGVVQAACSGQKDLSTAKQTTAASAGEDEASSAEQGNKAAAETGGEEPADGDPKALAKEYYEVQTRYLSGQESPAELDALGARIAELQWGPLSEFSEKDWEVFMAELTRLGGRLEQ